MATGELVSPRGRLPDRPASDARAVPRAWATLPTLIGVVLLAMILYSAFDHGSVTRGAATRVELVVAGLSVVAAFGWLWLGTISLRAPRVTLIGLGLLAAFALWSGLSVLWSVNPDQTWIEVNRVITYGLVAGLGIALGASDPRAVELIARGFLLAVLAVTLYALAQKLLPGLHVPGLFDLNQTGALPRLQDPLGYWNALALFMVMGAPAALALTVDHARSPTARLGAACALALVLITVPLTYSRGGLIALAVALVVGIGLGGGRLRALTWLILVILASLPAILVGLLMPELSTANVPLGSREWAGGVLAAAVLGGLAVVVLVGRRLMPAEHRIGIPARRARAVRRAAAATVVGLVVAGLIALAVSPRGFTGTISELWHGFAATHEASSYNSQRLLSAASENRWVWWKEAATAFSARPWQGWGAGSFPVLHLLYRRDTLPVQQPHSVPLQFLAETGVIGALLGLAAFVLLAAGAISAIRSRSGGPERLLAAALLGAGLAYGVHCLYDWGWNIPAVSLPAFLFLGLLAGGRFGAAESARPRRHSLDGQAGSGGSPLRALALAGATVWLCVFALSVELPQLAAEKASAALVAASSPNRATVRAAQAEASLASQLDPLSDAGPVAQATVALHDSRPQEARVYLQEAVARNPSDPEAWRLLAQVEYGLGNLPNALADVQRAVDLDPMGRYAQTVLARELHQAPPGSSATRFPTPGS